MSDPAPRKIRVLQLLAGCKVGGLEKVVLSLVSRLHRDFDFRVVVYDDSEGPLRESFAAYGTPVHHLARRPGVDLVYPFRLARVLRREKIDVVHAHNGTALFYGGLAAILAGGKRLVFTAHDRSVPQVPSRPVQWLLGRATTYAVAVSDLGRQDLLSVDSFHPERVVVVHNGADEADFAGRVTRDHARRALGLPEDAEIVGTVARLHPEKNVALLVRAFARVATERPAAFLVIAGDGPERAECERIAAERGVSDRCRFLGMRRDVAAVLTALDVFALSSEREGLPLAVLEAMGAELPVVSTEVGAVREVIADGESGWIVPPGSESALSEALVRVLRDPDRARAMGRRGGEIFRSAFTLERMASAYGRVYREAMEGVQ